MHSFIPRLAVVFSAIALATVLVSCGGSGSGGGSGDIDHMQATIAGVRSHHIRETCVFVDRDVVGIPKVAVHRVGGEVLRHRYAAQSRQVEDLHAMGASIIGNNVGMILVNLDIPPCR